jgi:hypothetical protein
VNMMVISGVFLSNKTTNEHEHERTKANKCSFTPANEHEHISLDMFVCSVNLFTTQLG